MTRAAEVYAREFDLIFPSFPLVSPRFPSFPLVSKLYLGTDLSPKLRFAQAPPMRSRYHVHEHDRAYFVTSTIVAWLPVFTTAARCNLLVGSLAYCRAHKA